MSRAAALRGGLALWRAVLPGVVQVGDDRREVTVTTLSHDTEMQLILLFDVGMVPTGTLAAFAVVTAEDGGQLLLWHPVWGEWDGALLSQAPPVHWRGDPTAGAVTDRRVHL